MISSRTWKENTCEHNPLSEKSLSSTSHQIKPGTLPDIWLKAAMLGSLWASIEIILGSFLHNMHVPLSGTLLAALGLILLINGYKLWPQPGLFWRTALITAIMKSVSPSAIIFGPMVGIFMEGLILEVMVRLFRGRWPGFIIGGAFAVTWSLFQKIFVLLLTFGPNFVKLYEQLYFMAARSLQLGDTVPIDLVKLIFVIDLSFGALVAALALNSGYHGRKYLSDEEAEHRGSESADIFTVAKDQSYHGGLLLLNLGIFFTGILYLDDLTLPVRAILILFYILFNIYRYTRSLHRLKRPGLWIQLIAIMSLSGMILGGFQSWDTIRMGLESGLSMALRALFVIFSFSALSIEIRNPLIISWFQKNERRVLFESISVAFEVLPRLINAVSRRRGQWRNPFRTLNRFLGILEQLREEHTHNQSRVILLIGDQGAGKSTLLKELVHDEEGSGFLLSGFISEGTWVAGERDHYDILDISSMRSERLCERAGPASDIKAGPFNFRAAGIGFGCQILHQAAKDSESIVIIDEVGHLEIQGEGWSRCMDDLLMGGRPMIWSIRSSLVKDVKDRWDLKFIPLTVKETDVKALIAAIRNELL